MDDLMQYGAAKLCNSSSSPDAQTMTRLKRMLLYTSEDEQYLMNAGAILAVHTEDMLNMWYAHMQENNYWAIYFTEKGAHELDYLQTLRPYFRQWIFDLCTRHEGSAWSQFEERRAAYLQFQNLKGREIAPLPIVFLRYLTTFIYALSEAGRQFLSKYGHAETEIALMHQAWFKAINFSVLLWIYPDAQSIPF